jgi:Na+/H+ antiporter NhaD/arsenite permease-like protein
MVATSATLQQDGIGLVIAAVAYFAYRLLSSARTEERRRREQGQPHTIRDTALLLLAALSVVGVLLCAIFLKPLNALVHSRAGFAAIIVLVGGGLTYLFNRRRAPNS